MAQLHTYHGYKIAVRTDSVMPVAVYDPRCKTDPALYECSAIEDAKRWIDSYRNGAAWAANEKAGDSK